MRKSKALADAEQKAEILAAENEILRERLAALEARQPAEPKLDPTLADHVRHLYEAGETEQAKALLRHGERGELRFEAFGPSDRVEPGSLRAQWISQSTRKMAAIAYFNERGLRPGSPEAPAWTRPDSDEPVPGEWLARIDPRWAEASIDSDTDEDGAFFVLDRRGPRTVRPRRPKPEDERLVRRAVAGMHQSRTKRPGGEPT